MFNEKVFNPATVNGFVFKRPIDPVLAEKIVLRIVADHNDGDYLTKFTDIDVNKIDLDLFFKAINVMKKLVQANTYHGNEKSWHITDLYSKLTEDDIKALYDFDMSLLPDDHDEFANDIDEYSIMDLASWDDYSTIRDWFPYPEWDSDDSDHIKSNHSLISITMQYHDGNGNIFNIENQD